MSKIRILIVDDHAIFREGIRALLTDIEELEIVGEAGDGREALDKIQQLEPDVAIMDVAMPLMDGLEATRRIHKEYPGVRILILTQYDSKEYVLPSLRAGASGCVPKRVVASELVSAIRAVYDGESFLHPSVAKLLVEDYLQRTERDPYDTLTRREREVLKLVTEGHSNRDIAEMLAVSVKTVLGHRTNVMEKLGIHNRTDLIKYAIRKGLISVDS